MPVKIKVLLALPDLQDLGVQHDVRCLMRYWNRDRFEPVMLLHKREGAFADQFDKRMLSLEIDRHILDIPKLRVLLRVGGYAKAFREFRPHAVISFVPYSNLASAWARPLSRVHFGLAVSEHAHVSASLRDPESFGQLFGWYYRKAFPAIYRKVDLVKCIAEESRTDLIDNFGIPSEKTRLIYNPVDMEEVQSLSCEPVEHPWLEDSQANRIPVLINVGRLTRQKRQDVLLTAFAKIRNTRMARLIIVGRGPHKDVLERQARDLGVGNDVAFLGFQRNPWKLMARSTLLVLSSDWEGLPCVLTEAMCLRLPIVSTRCPSGPAEMLLGGRAGLLCPVRDPDALASAIADALDYPERAAERAGEAFENLDRFRPEIVTRRYEGLAEELADLGLGV